MRTSNVDALAAFNHVFANFVSSAWSCRDSRLHQAIQYCLGGDGKRVRARLAMMVCQAYQKDFRPALAAATAVEMIHAYSLAHDDLPCMDNDDWRRGRPSLHKAFDEATALLAGDAILTDAMRVLSDEDFFPDAALVTRGDRLGLVRELTLAAGGHGMVFGQDLDMFWTGRGQYGRETLDRIHMGKTGALIGAACAMGALSAGASSEDARAWRRVGVLIGLAFQAVDDLLDQSDKTGKSAGKDLAQGKMTYLALHSCEEVQSMVQRYTEEALSLVPSGVDQTAFAAFVRDLVVRKK